MPTTFGEDLVTTFSNSTYWSAQAVNSQTIPGNIKLDTNPIVSSMDMAPSIVVSYLGSEREIMGNTFYVTPDLYKVKVSGGTPIECENILRTCIKLVLKYHVNSDIGNIKPISNYASSFTVKNIVKIAAS